MKKNILNISSKFLMTCMMCFSIAMTSCIPDNNPVGGSSGNGSSEEEKPVLKDPEGTKTIGLYAESNNNLAGLYYSKDGYLTSTNGWRLSYAASVNCLAYVDYIPRNTWVELLHVTYGDGFVGYNESEGFVRFYVSGIAVSEYGVVGIQLKYQPGFYGKDEAPSLSQSSIEFGEDGGEESIAITSKTYTVLQTMSKNEWCKVKQTASIYPYIIDGIDIEVEPNESAGPRTTEILLTTHEGKTSVIKISQDGKYIEE